MTLTSRLLIVVAVRLLLALVTFALPAAVRAQVLHHDFEDGTLQGWVPRGSAVLAVTSEAAATGLRSLKTTGRTAPWNGPGLNVMPQIQRDLVYQVRVSVRLTAGQAATQDTLRMTIERRVAGETTDRFDSIASSPTNGVTSGGWVTLQGTYRLTTEVTKLIAVHGERRRHHGVLHRRLPHHGGRARPDRFRLRLRDGPQRRPLLLHRAGRRRSELDPAGHRRARAT